MGYVLAIFKFFSSALRSIKNYVNPFSLCILTFWPYGIMIPYKPCVSNWTQRFKFPALAFGLIFPKIEQFFCAVLILGTVQFLGYNLRY